jgi:hypothetical protein
MTLAQTVLAALGTGPKTRPALETRVIAVGFEPASLAKVLSQLKKQGKIVHLRRASYRRQSLYGIVK